MAGDRITLEMNTIQVVMALGGGNPGAISACARLLKEGAAIDPDSALGGFGELLLLDSFGIYEERIWMLYKDVCQENLATMVAVLRACQLGELTVSQLQHAIDNRGAGIDLTKVRNKVAERLPAFQAVSVA